MNSLQEQIWELTTKVEQLYQVISQLDQRIITLFDRQGEKHPLPEHTLTSAKPTLLPETLSTLEETAQASPSFPVSYNSKFSDEYKDILLDDNHWSAEVFPTYEQTLTPETQIRRLTAQLTAAYNRIATLEEQLLARRIH